MRFSEDLSIFPACLELFFHIIGSKNKIYEFLMQFISWHII